MKTTHERFLEKLENTESGCWNWTAYLLNEYGAFRVGSKIVYAHRYAYQYYVGEIPEGFVTHHVCENKICVNPTHLELMVRGRHTRHHHLGKVCKFHNPTEPEDFYVAPNGDRTCRKCKLERTINWQRDNREIYNELQRQRRLIRKEAKQVNLPLTDLKN